MTIAVLLYVLGFMEVSLTVSVDHANVAACEQTGLATYGTKSSNGVLDRLALADDILQGHKGAS